MSNDNYYIGESALTSGGRVWNRNVRCNAKDMKLSDKQFADLVSKGKVKKGDPPQTVSRAKAPASSGSVVPKADEKKMLSPEEKAAHERENKLVEAIGTLFGPDGKPMKKEDFTAAGLPECKALEELLKDVEGFASISADERDKAFERYKRENAE